MITITQQDREAFIAVTIDLDPPSIAEIRRGEWDDDELIEAFAAHRLRTIEECAKIADRHDTGDCTREDMEARRIAEDIRKLGEA